MDSLDTPASLTYNNGNNFPPNFRMIVYVLLVVSIVLSMTELFLFGFILLLLSLFGITNRHKVIIDPESNTIHDYSQFLGFIKIGKKYPLDKFKYITTMPLIESQQIYGRSSNSITLSNSYTTITFFGERLRGKCIITKFDSKLEAQEIAIKLSDRLNMKYFEYDPKLVRQVLLGQATI